MANDQKVNKKVAGASPSQVEGEAPKAESGGVLRGAAAWRACILHRGEGGTGGVTDRRSLAGAVQCPSAIPYRV